MRDQRSLRQITACEECRVKGLSPRLPGSQCRSRRSGGLRVGLVGGGRACCGDDPEAWIFSISTWSLKRVEPGLLVITDGAGLDRWVCLSPAQRYLLVRRSRRIHLRNLRKPATRSSLIYPVLRFLCLTLEQVRPLVKNTSY